MGGNLKKQYGNLKKGLISWAIKGVLYKAYVGVVLMLSAGRWDWIAGWVYVGIFLAFDAATALVVIPRSPELLIERSRRNQDVKSWDKVIMPVAAGLLPLFSWIIAGLDQRFGWGPEVRLSLQAAGLVLTVIGHAIVVWAMGANAFFSVIVRIQEERGHSVAAGGPYRWIRHPGYVGAILFSLAIPFLLSSWWALIPSMGSVILYVLRTSLEDRTLIDELPGYADYVKRVKFRLIPGVW
jgi:protein-S-isoprenylcysteine O-methyltransferase Ste14